MNPLNKPSKMLMNLYYDIIKRNGKCFLSVISSRNRAFPQGPGQVRRTGKLDPSRKNTVFSV